MNANDQPGIRWRTMALDIGSAFLFIVAFWGLVIVVAFCLGVVGYTAWWAIHAGWSFAA